MKSSRIALVLLLLFAGHVLVAITVYPQDITCPICGTLNKVWTVGSYGSYACRPEGEFELVPCPIAYAGSVWSCKKCKFTSFVSDMKIPAEKVPAIRLFLNGLPKDLEVSRADSEASWRPKMDDQLFVAIGVYQILGRDNEFWSDLYRVAGFFASQAGKQQRAMGLRANALRMLEKMLDDPKRAAYRKPDFLAAGAMAAKLGDAARARRYLGAVKWAAYDPPDYNPSGLVESRREMNALARRILASLK